MMISNPKFQAILNLDFAQIKAKLMQVGSGEGWSETKADLVETEYRRFLYLAIAFPDELITPLEDVDTFWHYHILDTMKYAADCEVALGHFLHHFPYFGMRGEDDAVVHRMSGERMYELYEEIFGASYSQVEQAMLDADNIRTGGVARTDGGDAAKSAYCLRVGAEEASSAYCVRVGDKNAESAYCPATAAKKAESAYCLRVGDKQATSAYCLRVGDKQAKSAYCLRIGGVPELHGAMSAVQ